MSGQYENEMLRHLDNISKNSQRLADTVGKMATDFSEWLNSESDLEDLQARTQKLIEVRKLLEDPNERLTVPEWMQRLGAHYELLDEEGQFATGLMLKDDFWIYMENLGELGLIRQVKPEPVKDANQLEIPEIVTIAEEDERVRPVGFPDAELHNNISDCNAAGCPGCPEISDLEQKARDYLVEFARKPRVKVTSEGSEHDGRLGHVIEINANATMTVAFQDNGAAFVTFERDELEIIPQETRGRTAG